MPVTWEFRPPLVVVVSTGVYPKEAIESAVREAVSDPRFAPGMAALFDGRGSEIPVTTADVDWRADFFASLPAMGFSSRIAVLVRDGFLYEVSGGREFALESGGRSALVRLYLDEDKAFAWLHGLND
jgi:hypothetical protein